MYNNLKKELLMGYLAVKSMEEMDVLKKLILQKLIRSNVWGGKHTPLDFVVKGIPEHYRNTHKGMKAVEKVLKDLTNAEWILILAKRTGRGSDEHVSLNPRKVAEIKQFLEKNQSSKSYIIERVI